MYFDSVGCFEVVDHVGPGLLVAVVEDVVFGVHVPPDLVDLVGTVGSVLGHDDSTLKFAVDKLCIVALAPIVN